MIIKKDDSALVNCYSSTTIVIITFLLLTECSGKPSDTEVAELKRAFEQGGTEGFIRRVQQKQDEWKTQPLDIAVIGETGVGKSSFINAIRRLSADDEGAAAVDVVETTKHIESYTHPTNPLLKFWDLPGAGTATFPKITYLRDIDVDKYDFFMLITATRFTENDMWLALELRRLKKAFFFVRSKIGQDMNNDKKSHPETHNEGNVLRKIRQSTSSQLQGQGLGDIPVFLIDSYRINKYQFDELEIRLLKDYPEFKRTALLMSLQATSEEMIRTKATELRSRIWYAAMLSGGGAFVPVPFLSLTLDGGIILKELNLFKYQLGLDDHSLLRYATQSSTNYRDLKQLVDSSLGLDFFSLQGIKELAKHVPQALPGIIGNALEEIARFIPFIGGAIAAPLSYYSTKSLLEAGLGHMEAVALDVIRYPFEHSSSLTSKQHTEL